MMPTVLVDDVLVISTPMEGPVGSIKVMSANEDGQIIGRLALVPQEAAPEAAALFQAADEASECLNFALMEMEEGNLAAAGLRIQLPDGRLWQLGVDVGGLLVTEHCTHIAFETLETPRKYEIT